MSRTVAEWIGKTDDTPAPPRVRERVRTRDGNKCKKCTRPLTAQTAECDHITAIINGGQNRESNLQTLCLWCHSAKSREDTAIKSRTYRKRAKHYGIRQSSHPMPCGRKSPWKKTIGGKVVQR